MGASHTASQASSSRSVSVETETLGGKVRCLCGELKLFDSWVVRGVCEVETEAAPAIKCV